jgi:hypothetical protein
MGEEREKETLSDSAIDEGTPYPAAFPEAESKQFLEFLRGQGDAVSGTHAAWAVLGYALHELVGDPDGSAPVVPADPNALPPVNSTITNEQARNLRLGVMPHVHFGPMTRQAMANEYEKLVNQHKEHLNSGDNTHKAMAMNGTWLKLLIPILISALQQFLQ